MVMRKHGSGSVISDRDFTTCGDGPQTVLMVCGEQGFVGYQAMLVIKKETVKASGPVTQAADAAVTDGMTGGKMARRVHVAGTQQG